MEAGPINYKSRLEKDYELELDKSKALLKINLSSSLINISISYINNTNIIYKNSFDKESLSKINKLFKMFNSIEEIAPIIITIIDNKKYSLNKINESEIELILKVQILFKEEEIVLNLHNNNITKDDIIYNLCKIINNLSKRLEELEKWKKEKEDNEKEIEEKKMKLKKNMKKEIN